MTSTAMGLSARVVFERGDFTLEVALEVDGVTVMMGPNGAGKTTLLRLLVGALTPIQGRIVSSGEVLFDSALGVDRPPEERRLAYVPQGFALFPHLRALDNVAFGIRESRPAARRARALELLHDLGATDLADRYPAELSSGERQRVALARAVGTEPRLLLLDEPLSALDPASRPRLRASFAAWQARIGIPALIVTHDPADAQSFAEEIVILERGRVIQKGAPEDVAFHPASEFAATLTAGLLERPGAFHPGRRAISEDE